MAFVVRLGFHGLTAAIAVLLGARIEVLDGAPDQLMAFAGLVALAVAAGAGTETACRLRWFRGPVSDAAAAAVESAHDGPTHRDALSGLPGRDTFDARLRSVLEGRRRSDRMVAVLALELIDLETVSAPLPDDADFLLCQAGARLRATLRDTDVLAHLGVREFAVIQRGVEDPVRAWALCERLASALAEPFDRCGRPIRVGAQIGVALCPSDGQDPETLLEHARAARSRAESDRRQTFRFYQDALDARLRERRAFERDLVHALARDEFELEYQPQIDIASRRMVGVEALLRWNHPERGRIEPDHFIPLAEDTGLIVPIGAWVLEQACVQAVRWHRAGAPTLRMSVNMSPLQFRHPDLVEVIAGILARTGLPGECLELEITERVLMHDTAANLDVLRRLKGLGMRISIDDFGVGHSSLGYLRRFPFDEIKVDRSFVSALEHDPTVAAIVRATLSLGRSLGMVSVAEGVESARQLTLLDTEGCCIAQGFYFSPPVAASEIELMIRAAAARPGHDASSQVLPRAS